MRRQPSTSTPSGPTATAGWPGSSSPAGSSWWMPCPGRPPPARSSGPCWWSVSRRNKVLSVQNAVPTIGEPVVDRTVSRTLAGRYQAYADEVRRLVDAGYAVMRRTGGVDPRVGDIVREARLSNQAFYRHFRGKDELLLAVLDDGQ